MMELPEYLAPYRQEAEEALRKNPIREIEFSGRTYQILLGENTWIFLQLDQRGKIRDAFCSIEEEDPSHCVHIAMAYFAIFREGKPLHERFSDSLWNQLGLVYQNRIGEPLPHLEFIQSGNYVISNKKNRIIFSIEAKTDTAKKEIETLIDLRRKETEETSIKFSDLKYEEIISWREGEPSKQMQYILSFWSDLAKWLMVKQDREEPYQISFGYSSREIPNRIKISFPQLDVEFYLPESDLPQIIPALKTVNSPLHTFYPQSETVKEIRYLKKEAIFEIEIAKSSEAPIIPDDSKSIVINEDWLFYPKKGFYFTKKHSLNLPKIVNSEEIPKFITEHFNLIQKFLVNCDLHSEPIHLTHKLFFDKNWDLHIRAYVFEQGDLLQGDSKYYKDWIYLEDDGFYPIEGAHFDTVEFIVKSEEISEFIQDHRIWLNQQTGFQTHLISIDAQLNYSVNENQHLSFQRTYGTENAKIKDFGLWVYVRGKGFYSKATMPSGWILQSGLTIVKDQVSNFIKFNKEELKLIPDFFYEQSPMEAVRLKIELTDTGQIAISPEYLINQSTNREDLIFYDEFVYVKEKGFYELSGNELLPLAYRFPLQIPLSELREFLDTELPKIKKYISWIDPRIEKPSEIDLIAERIIKNPKTGRFETSFLYRSEKGDVPALVLWEELNKKQSFAFSNAGLIDLLNPRFNWLRHLSKSHVNKVDGTITLTVLELMRIYAIEEFEILDEESRAVLQELFELKMPDRPDISGLECSLRSYQDFGLKWLWFLFQHSLSGLLCDDMGLGKTHQAMGLIAGIYNLRKEFDPKFLIICPTSVIFHWQEKLREFLPDIPVYCYYGSERNLKDFDENYSILLTSYGMWRLEKEQFVHFTFELVIMDEIQIAKNHLSQVHKALQKVKGKMRLGLTGTPIENRLRELKSLFDLVLPTYMPNEVEYRNLFIRPIEKEESTEQKQILNRMIKPFILRRKKEDVLIELPEKTEEIAHCELSPEQEVLYKDVLYHKRDKILDELKDSESPIPYIHIFSLLTNLKQVCDHPALYLKDQNNYQNYQSGKWELFVELLSEARDSGQKVVVFSQYLGMLDIIELFLQENGIQYATIRGSTVRRGEQITKFQNDPTCEVFVGSLQAAGLGIDLTAASVVIHYDRWWNAARENQATDRTHRIGQTRGVQVFKLVTKNTFEEKIDEIITKKGKLMEEVIGVDDYRILKTFNREELAILLQYAEKQTY